MQVKDPDHVYSKWTSIDVEDVACQISKHAGQNNTKTKNRLKGFLKE